MRRRGSNEEGFRRSRAGGSNSVGPLFFGVDLPERPLRVLRAEDRRAPEVHGRAEEVAPGFRTMTNGARTMSRSGVSFRRAHGSIFFRSSSPQGFRGSLAMGMEGAGPAGSVVPIIVPFRDGGRVVGYPLDEFTIKTSTVATQQRGFGGGGR